MRRIAPVAAFLLIASCASQTSIGRVKSYRAAHERRDVAAEAAHLAADARIWFETREGDGDPLRAGGSGRWSHWDDYFHSTSTATGWKATGDSVSAIIHETNDFYRLLDWTPAPYRMTWWLGRDGRITGALVQAIPQRAASRMEEFREWAKQHEPAELEHVMPGGRIDPTGDRPERFAALLRKWRATASR